MGRSPFLFSTTYANLDPSRVETRREPEVTDALDLGRLLGRREAFNIVAARSSAADPTLLRDMRDQKVFAGGAD
jgi:hypothetical protein